MSMQMNLQTISSDIFKVAGHSGMRADEAMKRTALSLQTLQRCRLFTALSLGGVPHRYILQLTGSYSTHVGELLLCKRYIGAASPWASI